jgi:hypothetical protein
MNSFRAFVGNRFQGYMADGLVFGSNPAASQYVAIAGNVSAMRTLFHLARLTWVDACGQRP